MNRIVHFELAAENLDRASKFYSKVFGWEFNKWQEGENAYWLVTTGKEGNGINGGMLMKQGPYNGWTNIIGVGSVDKAIKDITKNGGKLERPKMAIPNMGYVAYFIDTEGNFFGVFEDNKNAK